MKVHDIINEYANYRTFNELEELQTYVLQEVYACLVYGNQ